MEAEARELNRGFCRWVVSGKPFVTLKLALSLDGQIAAAGGDSRWITGEAARRRVHRMRSAADAVLVGGETARRDDPILDRPRSRGARPPKGDSHIAPRGACAREDLSRIGGPGDRRLPEKCPGAGRSRGAARGGPGAPPPGARRGRVCARFPDRFGRGRRDLPPGRGGRQGRRLARGGGSDRPVRRLRRTPAPGRRDPRRVGLGEPIAVRPGNASPSPRSAASARTSKSPRSPVAEGMIPLRRAQRGRSRASHGSPRTLGRPWAATKAAGVEAIAGEPAESNIKMRQRLIG